MTEVCYYINGRTYRGCIWWSRRTWPVPTLEGMTYERALMLDLEWQREHLK